MKKIYGKLVRDKIPRIIQADGKKANTRILSNEEYLAELIKKLGEEQKELSESPSVEELADVEEVVRAIAGAIGADLEQLEAVRTQKAEERGAFAMKIFLKSVED